MWWPAVAAEELADSEVPFEVMEKDEDEFDDQSSFGSNLCEPIVEPPRRTANMMSFS